MQQMNERESMLVQYLVEAHGKERELEQSLESHIKMTSRMPYKKRLRSHLTETRQHARLLEQRVKQLGGADSLDGTMNAIQSVAKKSVAAAKAPLHAVRGSDDDETMLKNAKTEYFNEAEEIATYRAIEALAEKVSDRDTAMLARRICREEERMAKYLEGQITSLAKAVATSHVPAAQRRTRKTRTRTTRTPARAAA